MNSRKWAPRKWNHWVISRPLRKPPPSPGNWTHGSLGHRQHNPNVTGNGDMIKNKKQHVLSAVPSYSFLRCVFEIIPRKVYALLYCTYMKFSKVCFTNANSHELFRFADVAVRRNWRVYELRCELVVKYCKSGLVLLLLSIVSGWGTGSYFRRAYLLLDSTIPVLDIVQGVIFEKETIR